MLPFGSPMVDLRGLHNLLRTLCVPPPEAQASPMTRFIAKRGNGSGELYDPTVDDCHAAAAVVAVSLLPYEEGRAAMAPVGQAALEAQQICVDFHHSLPRSPDFFFLLLFRMCGAVAAASLFLCCRQVPTLAVGRSAGGVSGALVSRTTTSDHGFSAEAFPSGGTDTGGFGLTGGGAFVVSAALAQHPKLPLLFASAAARYTAKVRGRGEKPS